MSTDTSRQSSDTPSERYRRLVLWLKDHYGGARGWQTLAARRLNVHQVTLSKFLTGDREGVGLDVIERAIVSLPIDREYFFGWGERKEPGAYLVAHKHSAAEPLTPAEEGWFWARLSTRLGDATPEQFKLLIDEGGADAELYAAERRAAAAWFADNLPIVAEARRLAAASDVEVLAAWPAWRAKVRHMMETTVADRTARSAAPPADQVVQPLKAPPKTASTPRRSKKRH